MLNKKKRKAIRFTAFIVINAVVMYFLIYMLGIRNNMDRYDTVNGVVVNNKQIDFYIDCKYKDIIKEDGDILWYVSSESRYSSKISKIEKYNDDYYIAVVDISDQDYKEDLKENQTVSGEIVVGEYSFIAKVMKEKFN